MKRIDKIVLSLFIGPLLLTFSVSVFIFLMQFLWKYIDELVGKGLEFSLIIKLIGLFAMTMIPMALPLAVLLASTMTMGGLGERSELVAFKSSGVSLTRIMGGLFIFVFMLSIGTFFFSNNVLPWSNLKFYSLLYDIRKHKPALDIEEGVFYNGINNFTLKIGEKAGDDRRIYDIMVYDHTSGRGNDNIVMADSGELVMTGDAKYLVLTLFNGKQYKDVKQRVEKEGKKLHERVEMDFVEFRKVFDLSEFEMDRTDIELFSDNYHMKTIDQLKNMIDTLNSEIRVDKRRITEYSRSFIGIRADGKLNFKDTRLADWAKVDLDTMSIDSVFTMPLTTAIKNKALDNARNVKSYAETTTRNIQSKERAVYLNAMMIHKKLALSCACLVLFLIGAPMGAIVRKGGFGYPILISIGFYILFYVLNITGEKLVKEMVWKPVYGMWMPTFVLLPFGLLLTYHAITDSNFFKLNHKYVKWFSFIFKPFTKLFGA